MEHWMHLWKFAFSQSCGGEGKQRKKNTSSVCDSVIDWFHTEKQDTAHTTHSQVAQWGRPNAEHRRQG